MSTIRPNEFTEYELTEQEELASRIFTVTQVQGLMNLRAAYARDKITLKFNPSNFNEYIQQEAELQGKILLLTVLIENSKEATEVVMSTLPQEEDTDIPVDPMTPLDGNIFRS